MLDDRPNSKADVLWDAASQKLYVASHVFTTSAAATSSSSDWGRLYRYSYNAGAKTYALDAGFPVNITRGRRNADHCQRRHGPTLGVLCGRQQGDGQPQP
ncbi:MAG: hypothetical protein R2911_19405 [Caldilineaceae bacterium]